VAFKGFFQLVVLLQSVTQVGVCCGVDGLQRDGLSVVADAVSLASWQMIGVPLCPFLVETRCTSSCFSSLISYILSVPMRLH
jgi:hypothetical protein